MYPCSDGRGISLTWGVGDQQLQTAAWFDWSSRALRSIDDTVHIVHGDEGVLRV